MEKDGGPAFPGPQWSGQIGDGESGMSLRDYFAAAALPGLVPRGEGSLSIVHCYASDAYKLADAMLAEREKETK